MISFIGSGNLAWHLAPALDNQGFVVREVYSLKKKNAAALADRLYQAEVKTSLDFSTSKSRIFFVAVPDDAIEDIAREIVLPDESILVHTSGSMPLDALSYADTTLLGVFYPIQTFTKSRPVRFGDVPILIECSDAVVEKQLMKIASELSKNVKKINSQQRAKLHVAAVFAANFSNHMLTISKSLLEENDLTFEWLQPLVMEAMNKALLVGPYEAQTGPAVRGDLEVLDSHMKLLDKDKALSSMYKIISQHIIDTHQDDA